MAENNKKNTGSESQFKAVIDRLKQLLEVESDKDLALKLSMSPNAYHNRKKSSSLPYTQIIHIANEQKVNLNWLFNGYGPIYKDEIETSSPKKSQSENSNSIVIRHSDLVSEFEDHDEAIDANKNLIILEKLDPEEFYATTGRIRGKVKSLLRHKKNHQKNPELK